MEHMDADAGKRLDFPQDPQEEGISLWFSDSLSFPGGRVVKKVPRNHKNNKEKPWIASPNYGEIRFMF